MQARVLDQRALEARAEDRLREDLRQLGTTPASTARRMSYEQLERAKAAGLAELMKPGRGGR